MSLNKLALIRYKTIDDCLQNRRRKWTLEDLITKVSDALEAHEGIGSGISKRTIQADLQVMRSDKLGYNAPIVVKDKKYYCYDDADYSITNTPINQADITKMKEVVGVLKQFNGFGYFEEMSELITRLENNLYKSTQQSANCIQFETNQRLKGIEHINPLYQAVLHQRSLSIEYKSFKAEASKSQVYYPYLLKEYRNRWFLIAKAKDGKYLLTLALDRIESFTELPLEKYRVYEGLDFDKYFNDLLGVTKNERDRPQKVILHIDKPNAPYVLTKPLHASQTILQEDDTGTTISLHVVLNFELEREILGFGEFMQVIAPRLLYKKIKRRLENAALRYDD